MSLRKPNFGKLAKNYDAMRPEYPSRALKIVQRAIGGRRPFVLDLGCGTGISTRQLAKRGMRVVGYDIDPAMLSVARKRGGHGIKYVRGDARKLAFKNATFGGVTAFTALHWFLEKNSLREIKRVLKPNTPLCVVQPEHTAPFRNDLNRIIQKEFPKKRVAQYSTERFVTALRRAGFRRVNEKVIDVNFTYSLPQYLILIQTYSVWNRVPTNARRTMLAILKKHFATKLVRGRIHDTQEITVTVGYT